MQRKDFGGEVAFSLLNAPVAGDVVQANGLNAITGLPTFKDADYKGYVREDPVAETKQVVTVNLSTAVAASGKYRLKIGSYANREFEHMGVLKTFGYTAPAVLTGTAALDEHNMYVKLAKDINRSLPKLVNAYPLVTLTHAAGTFVVGEVLTGATTGAKGIVVSSSSGTCQVALTTLDPYKIFTGTENLDDETGTGPFAMSGITLGVGLRLVDTGNYFDPKEIKNGATVVRADVGFSASDITVTTAAVYSRGQGAWLLGRVPVLERTSGNLASGAFDMATNQTPDPTAWYYKYILNIEVPINPSASQNSMQTRKYSYVVWAKGGGTVGSPTAPTAFNAAIAAL